MSSPKDYRALANEQRTASAVHIDKLTPEQIAMSAVIVAQVSANLFDSMADLMELQDLSAVKNATADRVQRVLENTSAIRHAAARGDWDEYDRIVNGGPIDGPAEPVTSGTT